MSGLLRALREAVLPNTSRRYLARCNREFAHSMRPGARLLDAGAGEAPYRALFAHVQYESADFQKVDKPYAQSTYVCDLCQRIPVEDGRFEYVVCNQTLEHLREPARALSELHRVLAPGGRILCTAPFFFEEHEQPYDFFRYTQFGHRHLFTQAGFEVERIEWLEGFFGTCGYMLHVISRDLPWIPRGAPALLPVAPLLLLIRLAALCMAALLYRLDLVCRITSVGFPKNYVVIARRAAPGT